jgi:glycosyltransferase involved in cell wall biosynthesis
VRGNSAMNEHPLRTPVVSVVIPAYNAERFIGTAIDSAAAQTHTRTEILVVDDGSTDGTAAVVRSKAARDERIRLISQPNLGVAAARNRGLAEARGAFFAPLDADDLWHPQKLELQLAAFARVPKEVALIYAWSYIVDEEGRTIAQSSRRTFEGRVLPDLVAHNFIGNASVPLVRIEAAREVGGYDETLRRLDAQGCEDIKFHFAIAERWSFGVVPQPLVGYRRSNASMSMDLAQMARSRQIVFKDIRQRHPNINSKAFWLSDQRFALWSSAKCLACGRAREGYWLVAKAWCRDPLLPVRQYARSYVASVIRRLSGRSAGPAQ